MNSADSPPTAGPRPATSHDDRSAAPAPIPLGELPVPREPRLEALVPPPRFVDATLGSYLPQDASQARARERVAAFVADAERESAPSGGGWRRWLPFANRAQAPQGRGLYLDGGFGVGKTHLLAAAWHRAAERGGSQGLLYVSFQELVHLIGVLGRERATARLADHRLICIDEFELDDPGNTLIVKSFLADVFARGGAVVTTSNTPPEAQGRGRFNADDFTREIQSIAARFEAVEVGGPDYRHRDRVGALLAPPAFERALERDRPPAAAGPTVVAEWEGLHAWLERHHPSRYRGALEPVAAIFLRGVETIPGQNEALRFVHFIDRVYDLRVGLRASGSVPLAELYAPSYREGAYAKKHHRSLSRLTEMLDEPLPGAPAND